MASRLAQIWLTRGLVMAAAMASCLALSGCLSIWAQPDQAGAPAAAPASLPPPQQTPAPSQATTLTLPSGAAAPNVAAPPAPPRPSGNEEVIVPGTTQRQVPTPPGDPRSVSERMADIRSWDSCVMRAQGAGSGDPMRPQLESPEEICRRTLGMHGRTAVPDSRKP